MDSRVATRDETPAMIVVAWANLAPVPPLMMGAKKGFEGVESGRLLE